MRILVTGASGFVGSRLVAALDGEGHEVRAMTRRPGRYEGAGRPIAGDVGEERSLREALEGCEAAYYLVHSLDHPDFERKDADAARAFAAAAAATGLDRIVYLGGLGQDSDQLSRLLGGTGVPVTVLRAGIVVGHGGVSWELTRQLVAHLPAMVTPRWVSTRTQPIAVADVVRYLVGVLDAPEAAGRVFEVGGPEVLTYLQMMTRVAEIQNRHLFVVPVPLLSPQLSSRWLALVTDVDLTTGRSLIDSMSIEVVVTDDAIRSPALSQRLLGTEEIVLIHHTDCGMLTFSDDDFRRQVQDDVGVKPPWAAEAFPDLDEDVRQSIARINASPFIPRKESVRGFVYDVRDGSLREVS